MSKFKRIFYPIYILTMIAFGYLAIRGMGDTDRIRVWFEDSFAIDNRATWILASFFMLTMLMLVELIIENVRIRSLKNEVGDLEEEIVRLKAKLYDKSETDDTHEDEDEEWK